MEKGSFIVHALAVASAGSMGSQSRFPRYACPVAGIDRFKGDETKELLQSPMLFKFLVIRSRKERAGKNPLKSKPNSRENETFFSSSQVSPIGMT